MNAERLAYLIRHLKARGIQFQEGLIEAELNEVEQLFTIRFPPDFRLFLSMALPVSTGFVDWRLGLSADAEEEAIRQKLNWPLAGLLFEIEYNGFWLGEWGEKPNEVSARKAIAASEFAHYPKLVPIYSHRYMPSLPEESGLPVYSVHQTDIIYYGDDLASYFANEFGIMLSDQFNVPKEPKGGVPFWSCFLDE